MESMDSLELTRWIAAYEVNGLGEDREDLRTGMICAAIRNAQRTKKEDYYFEPWDFFPNLAKLKPGEQDGKEEKAKALSAKLKSSMGLAFLMAEAKQEAKKPNG